MRTLGVLVVALIGGFFLGILLSEWIGIVGFLLFDRVVGIKFIPIILAVVSAGGAFFLRFRRAL